jgi:5,10-methylenetetrahydrofolate reductase
MATIQAFVDGENVALNIQDDSGFRGTIRMTIEASAELRKQLDLAEVAAMTHQIDRQRVEIAQDLMDDFAGL